MRLTSLIVLIGASCATPALAQDFPEPPMPEMSRPAMGGPGMRAPERETLAEMQARMEQVFDRLDTDNNEVVTSAELGRSPGGRMLMRADRNGDGDLTREEMREGTTALFATMDANGDGVVTADERPQRRR